MSEIQIDVEGKKYKLLPDSESGLDDACVGCAFYVFLKCDLPSGSSGDCIIEFGIWKEVKDEQT